MHRWCCEISYKFISGIWLWNFWSTFSVWSNVLPFKCFQAGFRSRIVEGGLAAIMVLEAGSQLPCRTAGRSWLGVIMLGVWGPLLRSAALEIWALWKELYWVEGFQWLGLCCLRNYLGFEDLMDDKGRYTLVHFCRGDLCETSYMIGARMSQHDWGPHNRLGRNRDCRYVLQGI